MKMTITATLLIATLFSASAHSSVTKDGIVNVDGLSDSCVMREIVDNVVLVCPKKDKELLADLINDNKETN